jgi:uncharacterized SAM-binding protein YcdF (DUF218 family)
MEKFLHNLFFYFIFIDIWIVWLLLLGTILLFTKWWTKGRGVVVVVALMVIFVGISPVPIRMAADLEDRFPQVTKIPENVVGAILLGGSFACDISNQRGVACYNIAGSRVIDFAQLAHQNPNLRLVFTGGGVPILGGNEAELMKKVYDEIGMNTSRIMFETKSKNTVENAKFSYEMVKPQKGEVWLLVTSALHMPRAMGVFRKAGWNVMAYPVDYHTRPSDKHLLINRDFLTGLVAWRSAVREYCSMIRDYVAGNSSELFPRP